MTFLFLQCLAQLRNCGQILKLNVPKHQARKTEILNVAFLARWSPWGRKNVKRINIESLNNLEWPVSRCLIHQRTYKVERLLEKNTIIIRKIRNLGSVIARAYPPLSSSLFAREDINKTNIYFFWITNMKVE